MTATHDIQRDARTPESGVAGIELRREWHRRVSGAPVWSGFAVALAVWVLLEVVLAAVDLVPLGIGASQFDAGELWWTGAASVVALFVGGLVAGAASRSHRAADGTLQGVITWAIAVVAILVLSALGAGIGFGAFGETLSNAENQASLQADQQQAAQEQGFVLGDNDAQQAAGLAALFLGLTVVAAAAGGAAGSKMTSSDRSIAVDVR